MLSTVSYMTPYGVTWPQWDKHISSDIIRMWGIAMMILITDSQLWWLSDSRVCQLGQYSALVYMMVCPLLGTKPLYYTNANRSLTRNKSKAKLTHWGWVTFASVTYALWFQIMACRLYSSAQSHYPNQRWLIKIVNLNNNLKKNHTSK